MMLAPDDDEDDAGDRFAGHVPGSGIDFSIVAGLRVLPADFALTRDVPPTVRHAVRLAPPERLVRLDLPLAVGDIVVRRLRSGRITRPMQVRHVEQDWSVALDDRSLNASWRPSPFVAAMRELDNSGPAAVWRVLDEAGIHRCPRCRAPGSSVFYGLPSGPTGSSAILGGCTRQLFEGEIGCTRCSARWDVSTGGRDR